MTATVYVQCGAFYRADATPALAPVGEVEFVNGVAAMSASGLYGPFRAAVGTRGREKGLARSLMKASTSALVW